MNDAAKLLARTGSFLLDLDDLLAPEQEFRFPVAASGLTDHDYYSCFTGDCNCSGTAYIGERIDIGPRFDIVPEVLEELRQILREAGDTVSFQMYVDGDYDHITRDGWELISVFENFNLSSHRNNIDRNMIFMNRERYRRPFVGVLPLDPNKVLAFCWSKDREGCTYHVDPNDDLGLCSACCKSLQSEE